MTKALLVVVALVCLYGCVWDVASAMPQESFKSAWLADPTLNHVPDTRNADLCTGQPDGFYSIPDTCASDYCACIEQLCYPQTCPGGGTFDPVLLKCVAPSTASCLKTTTSTTTTTTSTTIPTTLTELTSTIQQMTEEQSSTESTLTTQKPTTESTLTTPKSTTTATTVTTVVTPKPTAESTFTTPKSTTTATTVTSAGTTPFACPGTNGAFPNPTNCRTFYMCSNGIPYLYDCPSNLVFNAATGNCDYEVNVAGPCGSAR